VSKKTDKVQALLKSASQKASGDFDLKPSSAVAGLPWNQEVGESKDLARILAIPRRTWTDEEAKELAERLTPLLAREGGEQTLRPVQAIALHDLGTEKGLVCTARVGGGKTLIALLASYVVKAVRPLILVPANLKEKTLRDMKRYAKHWEIPQFIRVESYELLSRKEHARFWEDYRPDCVMCDEAHHIKNTRAAITKRMKRYLTEIRPNTPLGLLSGTLTNRSLKEYWHSLRWSLPYDKVPMPHNYDELDMWAMALDEKVGVMNRIGPGALRQLCNEEELELMKTEPLRAARQAYRRRLVETPGVVTTKETFEGASLLISALKLEPPAKVKSAIDSLRTEWETLDGWPISDAVGIAQHEKELALGFYYIWDPRPPEAWIKARKEWCAAARQILAHNNRHLDTEAQAVDAVREGLYPSVTSKLEAWEEVKDTFKPNIKAVWVDEFAIEAAASWAKENKGIIWTFHRAFGEKLAEVTGLSFYCNEGLDAEGRFIEDHPAGEALIASMHANREGKNLQKWNKNLVVHPLSSGKWWEQLIGRTHREGQPEDSVFVDMFFVTMSHLVAFYRARGDAQFVEDTTGQVQKLLYADLNVPEIEDMEEELRLQVENREAEQKEEEEYEHEHEVADYQLR
jgi:hypothetical protein